MHKLNYKWDTADEEFFERVEEIAMQRLTDEARIELRQLRKKLDGKLCGFDKCANFPKFLRGMS